MKTWILAMCTVSIALAAPVPKEVKKTDAHLFEGPWWEAGFENRTYADQDHARRFTFDRDGGLKIAQSATAAPTEYKLAIDPATNPPSFSFAGQDGRIIFNGVYRVDAETLRFVLTALDTPRAKDAKPGAGAMYYELKRVK